MPVAGTAAIASSKQQEAILVEVEITAVVVPGADEKGGTEGRYSAYGIEEFGT